MDCQLLKVGSVYPFRVGPIEAGILGSLECTMHKRVVYVQLLR